jgi:PAS domain S-box-containing protein
MRPPEPLLMSARLRNLLWRWPRYMGAIAALVGVAAIVGWWLHLRALYAPIPQMPMLQPNTALIIVLMGIGLIAAHSRRTTWPRRASRACAIAVLALATITLLEYILGADLGIDRMIAVGRADVVHPFAGRPSPQTTLTFSFAALSLLLSSSSARRRRRAADYLALVAGSLGALVLLGSLLDIEQLYGMPNAMPQIGMSPITAGVVVLLATGLIGLNLERGIFRVVASEDAGGIVARRLLLGLGVLAAASLVIVLVGRKIGLALEEAAAVVMYVALVETSWIILSTANKLSVIDRAARRATAALAESEERTRQVIDGAAEAVYITDLDGRYIEVNDAACRMLGCDRDYLIGKSILDVLPEAEGPKLRAVRDELLRGGSDVREWHMRRPNGAYMPIEVSSRMLPDGRWLGFGRDMTERKLQERMREEWSAMIAHDLRQPASTIAMSADFLLEQTADALRTTERAMLERIGRAVKRLDRMIADLADTSQISAGRLEVRPQNISIHDSIRSVIETTHPGAAGFEVLVTGAADAIVCADPDRLHQVLSNLVTNAIKYGTPGTELGIDVAAGPTIEVTVTNRGPGIAREELPLLFERFARTRSARGSRTPGLGLGLFIARGIVEAHGGRMWAESEPGQTTSFHFTVPRA